MTIAGGDATCPDAGSDATHRPGRDANPLRARQRPTADVVGSRQRQRPGSPTAMVTCGRRSVQVDDERDGPRSVGRSARVGAAERQFDGPARPASAARRSRGVPTRTHESAASMPPLQRPRMPSLRSQRQMGTTGPYRRRAIRRSLTTWTSSAEVIARACTCSGGRSATTITGAAGVARARRRPAWARARGRAPTTLTAGEPSARQNWAKPPVGPVLEPAQGLDVVADDAGPGTPGSRRCQLVEGREVGRAARARSNIGFCSAWCCGERAPSRGRASARARGSRRRSGTAWAPNSPTKRASRGHQAQQPWRGRARRRSTSRSTGGCRCRRAAAGGGARPSGRPPAGCRRRCSSTGLIDAVEHASGSSVGRTWAARPCATARRRRPRGRPIVAGSMSTAIGSLWPHQTNTRRVVGQQVDQPRGPGAGPAGGRCGCSPTAAAGPARAACPASSAAS